MRLKLNQLIKSEIDEINEECNFTEDEEAIFLLLTKGKSRVEISFETGYSPTSVSRYTTKIYNKIVRCEKWAKLTS